MMIEKNTTRYRSSRGIPRQKRGQDKVKLILATAARLFNDRGVAEVTTNDIAEAAGIPVGSVYSYFEDKNAILEALIYLYGEDIEALTLRIAKHPLLKQLSWQEIVVLLLYAWGQYVDLNALQRQLSFVKSDPSLKHAIDEQDAKIQAAYCEVTHTKLGFNLDDSLPYPRPCELSRHYILATVEMIANTEKPDEKDRIIKMAADMLGGYADSLVARTEAKATREAVV